MACTLLLTGVSTTFAVDAYHVDHRSTPKIQFSPVWNTPDGLSGEALAVAFLSDRAIEYQLPADISNLRISRTAESILGTHYSFQQALHGFDVDGAEVIVSILKTGDVYRVFNNSYPVKTAPSAPVSVIGTEAAYDIAWAALRGHGDLLVAPLQRTVYVPVGEDFQLQTIVDLELTAPYGGWRARIDARTGVVISIENTRIHRVKTAVTEMSVEEQIGAYTGPTTDRLAAFERYATEAATVAAYDPSRGAAGTGVVFDPDPRTTLGDATLQDGSPASAFTAAYFTRNLLDITNNSGTYTLTGPWVTIANWDPPNTPPSTTTDGNWTATRGDNAFNDAFVYFHLDQSQRYMQSLGFTGASGIQQGSIVADTDGANGADNSYYTVGSNRLAFGHGCVDDSEDADVVLHEYGHAIHYSINSNWGGGDSGAIGEGFGDYWAGSYSYITPGGNTFHPEWVFSWDGHGTPVQCWNGRFMDRFGAQYDPNATYGAHQSIPGGYQSDELWSTPLFQTLIAVMDLGHTRDSVDQIILESHFGLGSGVRMRELANVTIQTAQLLQPGNPHADIFVQKFLVHNIVDLPFVGLQVDAVSVSDAGTNGAADPGETVHLHVTLKNEGTLGAVNVSALLTSGTPGVVIGAGSSAYGDIAAGGSAVNQSDFILTIPSSHTCGDPVDLSLEVDYVDGAITTTNLGFELGTGVVLGVSQSVEPGLPIPDNNSGGISSVMTVSGTGASVTSDFNIDINLTHTYIGDLIVRLTSPDGTTVTLHDRSGSSANDIIGNYPGTLTPAQPLSDFLGDAVDGDWTMFVSDNAGVDLGTLNSWGIHDVQGYDCQEAADVPTGPTTVLRFALAQNTPNPLTRETSILFSVTDGSINAQLDIIDVSGRVIRTLANEVLAAGEHVRVWDGTDDLGNSVGAGVYFYRLQQGSEVATRKLLSIR